MKKLATFRTPLEEKVLMRIEMRTSEDPTPASEILKSITREFAFLNPQAFIEVPHRRRIQEVIQSMRMAGIPICANGRGYYWPSDEEELHDYIEVFEGRVKEMCMALSVLKKSYRKIKHRVSSTITAE